MSSDPRETLSISTASSLSDERLSGAGGLNAALAPDEVAIRMPHVLLPLLERRYLSPLQPENWRFELPSADAHRPLLREVTRLGRPEPGQWAKVMPHLLTACHEPGHALIMALHGCEGRNRIYLGCRRLAGGRSTEDYLAAQESALRGFFVGLKLSGKAMRLDTAELPEMAWLAQSAPAMAAMTGIASGRLDDGTAAASQSFDHLIEAAGNHNALLMVVATPADAQEIDATLDRLRLLKSEIHSYARRSINRVKSLTEGSSRTEVAQQSPASLLPLFFFAGSAFLQLTGIPAGQALTSIGFGISQWGSRQEARHNRQVSSNTTASEGATVELLDANAEFCEDLLNRHLGRLQEGRSHGLWHTSIYIASESEAGLQSIGAALRSTCSGASSGLDPLRLHILPAHIVRPALESGQILRMTPAADKDTACAHPLGSQFDSLATCLNSKELSLLVNMPAKEVVGVAMRDHAAFALSVPPADAQDVPLGYLLDHAGRPIEKVGVNRATLNRHVFVTGMTGYGKSNTCMALLIEAHRRFQTPFLVIEPAKAEYRYLCGIPELQRKLRVLAVAGESSAPLRLNPLCPLPGIPLGRHIDLLKAVFNASFPMFAGMAAVLEDAIHDVYQERGWSLYTSGNPYLDSNLDADRRSALIPDLQDLHDQIDVVLERKKYGPEVHQNMGAALRSRLHSLMVGNKGLMLNTRRSIPPQDLFFNPTIIELQNMGDDEEKAFVMALLFVFLYEFAEVRQGWVGPSQKRQLQHVTLIEEAHRLLKATPAMSSLETGDPRGKAVTMFTDMLAEMRAYGEGFIIADQSPTKLVSDTLKNTNLKIIHRLSHPDDRSAAGGCANLTHEQMRHLNNLPPGQAVVHDERIGEAVLVQVSQFKDVGAPVEGVSVGAPEIAPVTLDIAYLYRNSGCSSCSKPCVYLPLVHDVQLVEKYEKSFDEFFELILFADFEAAVANWAELRRTISSEVAYAGGGDGPLFCAILARMERWPEELIKTGLSRGRLSPKVRLSREAAFKNVGELLRRWSGSDAPPGDYIADLRSVQKALISCTELHPGSDGLKQDCPECAGDCIAFRFVSPRLKDLEKPLVNRLLGSLRTETGELIKGLVNLALLQVPLLSRHVNHSGITNKVMRCLLANLAVPPAAKNKQAELLAALSSVFGNATERQDGVIADMKTGQLR
jgi:hypothetical protein